MAYDTFKYKCIKMWQIMLEVLQSLTFCFFKFLNLC